MVERRITEENVVLTMDLLSVGFMIELFALLIGAMALLIGAINISNLFTCNSDQINFQIQSFRKKIVMNQPV